MSDNTVYLYDRNSKRVVSPEPQDTFPVIKGTEDGHFFAVALTNADAIIGVRQLSQDIGDLDVEDGTQSRIRLLPIGGKSRLVAFAEKLGFTKKTGGHYSIVTNSPATVLSALSAFIEVA